MIFQKQKKKHYVYLKNLKPLIVNTRNESINNKWQEGEEEKKKM